MNTPIITFSYNKNKLIFSNLKINSFSEYNVTALCGHNGAGKTTLLKILGGIYPYDNKTKKLSYVSKWFIGSNRTGLISNLSLSDHLSLLSNLIIEDKNNINNLINKFELNELLNYQVYELSDGQFIKAAIFLAIICRPEYLFLDEVFNSLDYISLKIVLEEMQILKTKTHIIFASHNLDIVNKFSERIIIIKNGRITYDTNNYNNNIELKIDELKNIYIEKA